MSAYMVSDENGDIFYRTVTSTCTGLYAGVLSQNAGTLTGYGVFSPSPSAATCGTTAGQNVTFSGTFSSAPPAMTSQASGGAGAITWTDNQSQYAQASSLSAVNGNWRSIAGDQISVDSTGHMSETDLTSGCTITGQFSIIDSSSNVYGLSMTYANCTGVPADLTSFVTDAAGLNSATVTGLASIDNSVTPNQLDLWSLFQFTDGTASAIAYVIATAQ
jgi:hypothetical protein